MFGQKNNDASQQDSTSDDQSTVVAGSDNSWQHPGQPLTSGADQTNSFGDTNSESVTPEPASAPVDPAPTVSSPTSSAPSPSPFSNPSPISSNNDSEPKTESEKSDKDDLLDNSQADLLDIKQKALNELSPLMTHLDQTPEEKFRTLMMMLQASDDQKLVKQVYEAAQGIKDDKVRAQALLDIVNEINYFTTQSNS